jgi:hypothetical protein
MKGIIEGLIEYCEVNGYTYRRITIIIYEIERFSMLIRDILQFFQYFIRPDFRQKPDLEMATEKYKEIADKHTVDELRKLVGKHSKIDFESLGKTRISAPQIEELREDGDTTPEQLEYDAEVDGPVELSDDDEPTIKGALVGGNPFDSKYEPKKMIPKMKAEIESDTLGIKEMPGDEMQKFMNLNMQARINDERKERKIQHAQKK